MNTTLYYREGASDKVYQASIVPYHGSGYAHASFLVTFAFGRRGSTLTTGQKTPQPVSLAEAQKIHAKLIKDKKAKGYTEDTSGTPAPVMQPAAKPVCPGYERIPMLLNSITDLEMNQLLLQDRWCAQEKHDGKRMTLEVYSHGGAGGKNFHATNKRGLPCGCPEPVAQAMRSLPFNCIIDGECVGEVFHAFDLLALNNRDLRSCAYRARLTALEDLLCDDGGNCQTHLQCVETETDYESKAGLLEELRQRNAEGIVFKDVLAPWRSDRPNSGGPALKFKFVETASCIVAKQNAKNSVGLVLLDQNGRHVPVGNVTIPPNHLLPPPFAVCEVRYLYAYPGGSLFQPVYLGPRDDVAREECTLSQLKLKAA